MRRTFLIMLSVLVCTPFVAWVLFPWYAPWLLNKALSNVAVEVRALQVERPRWQHIALTALALESPEAKVLLRHAKIHWQGAFKNISVTIKKAEVHQQVRTELSSTQSAALISSLLPQALLSGLPNTELILEQLVVTAVDIPQHYMPTLKKVQLAISAGELRLHSAANFVTRDGLSPSYNIDFTAAANNQLSLIVSKPARSERLLAINMAAKKKAKQITASLDITIESDKHIYLPLTFPDNEKHNIAVKLTSQIDIAIHDAPLDMFIAKPQFTAKSMVKTSLINSVENGAQNIPGQTLAGISSALAAKVDIAVENDDWQLRIAAAEPEKPLLDAHLLWAGKKHGLAVNTPSTLIWNGAIASSSVDKALPTGGVLLTPDASIVMAYTLDDTAIARLRLKDLAWNGFLPSENAFSLSVNSVLNADVSRFLAALPTAAGEQTLSSSKNIHLALPAALEFTSSQVHTSIVEAAELTADKVAMDSWSLLAPSLRLPAQTIVLDYASLLPNKVSFLFSAQEAFAQSYSARSIGFQGELTTTGEQLQVDIQNKRQVVKSSESAVDYVLPRYRLLIDGQLSPIATAYDVGAIPRVDFRLLNACSEPLFAGSLKDMRYLEGGVFKIFAADNSLSRWLDFPQLNNDLVSGALDVKLQWDLQSKALPDLDVNLQYGKVEGAIGNLDAIQLVLSHDPTELANRYLIQGHIGAMNIGVEAKDLDFSALLSQAEQGVVLDVKKLQASVFSGRVWLQNERWQQGQASSVRVNMENLDLAEIVRTQNIQGLKSSGLLSGFQELSISADGEFSSATGTLFNTERGEIRYHSGLGDDATLNEQLKLTMDVLENFQYQKLETETEYSAGNLHLRSKISGSNPDIAQGQQVDLNLNTEMELSSAYQAMRLQAGLEARIEKLFDAKGSSKEAFCQPSQ